MKTKFVLRCGAAIALVLCAMTTFADEDITRLKLWIHREYNEHGDVVLFIQDLETGTRCYAITNAHLNTSGYAISCVPKQ